MPIDQSKDDDFCRARYELIHGWTPFTPHGWDWLSEHYRWSRREADVALHVMAGLTDRRIAKILGIGLETVHAHEKALFRQTKTHSRLRFAAELAMRCPAEFRWPDEVRQTPPLPAHYGRV